MLVYTANAYNQYGQPVQPILNMSVQSQSVRQYIQSIGSTTPAMLSKYKQSLILHRTILRYDPLFRTIVYTSSHAVLYVHTSSWQPAGIEGNVIIYRRASLPSTKLVMFNKRNADVFDLVLHDIDVDVVRDMVVLRCGMWYGLWMAVDRDRERIAEVLRSVAERERTSVELLAKIHAREMC